MYHSFLPVDIRILPKDDGVRCLDDICRNQDDILLIASENTITRLQLGNLVKQKEGILKILPVPPNPSVEDLLISLKKINGQEISKIVCIGGGSAIDLGKGISALHYLIPPENLTYNNIHSAIKEKMYLENSRYIDIIAVPTTAGTGSEVTQWATIWDTENMEKLSIDCDNNYPKMALVVPEFTMTMPKRLTLATGLDALSHAMEAFWAKHTNPLSQVLALEAVRYIKDNLPSAINHPDNILYRNGMSLGSLLAGIAFSRTRTTACHSISYPLTMKYHIEHGFAVALTLEAIANINLSNMPEIGLLYNIFGGRDGFSEWLKEVTFPIQTLRLAAFGVEKRDIGQIVTDTFTQGRMDNNPVALTPDDVRNILTDIL